MQSPSAVKLYVSLKKLETSPAELKTKKGKYSFHILQSIRELYSLEKNLFQISGNVIFANFFQARYLAERMNEKRDTLRFPETAVKAGHINAMGLIDEILHYVLGLYKERVAPGVFSTALGHLKNVFEPSEVDRMIASFRRLYPPAGDEESISREMVLEEMILLWLANNNPAFEPFVELFDHTEIRETTIYPKAMEELRRFFDTQPKFGLKNQNIIDMLEEPAKKDPRSLSAQLAYMQQEWGMVLGKYLLRLLQGLDFIKEEERPFFTGPGPAHEYTFHGEEEEAEHFSRDLEWMPEVVLLAKTIYVWLYQLTNKYGRPIEKLDQIPEEEIDKIAASGFTGLWLIGIWERSPASRKIKRMCGNPEAEASAYSLMEYEIADDLGGWEALHSLKTRCMRRGIRLASDMVPNHTGIDSKWVINHPDWFIQLPHKPYPQYSYNGENLGRDDRVNLYIEDHYYDKTDAAVTFKRLDTHTGRERYIYHGNDGTSMPWNDTAQLDFLQAEVREAVIQTILHVARNFSIIRFDAAMTLAKKHFHRLWYPEPGSGGDIPTRAEYGLPREDFNRKMPVEFWREVVKRIQEEVPDTLLLAEAFWMMEGYFVRTLGMHRVYNSAFMNMLKNEENKKYRNTIKNTQEFDPEILKRYVNFMNNPDEDTAIAQFGTGDKYFGVCTLMVTMPGLPMFGHGQTEGFTEKYGMEYRRSYWEELENTGLIQRHELEIYPLMKKRYLFAGVGNFLLYDVYTGNGDVNENVFAYSNKAGGECALVLYNNSNPTADGWIHMSAAFAVKQEDGSKQLVQRTLAWGLGIPADRRTFVIFREQRTGLWYIRNCKEIWDRGMYCSLSGYETHVFLNFQVVYDNEFGHYNQLATFLDGKGTENIQRSLQEVFLAPVHTKFRELLSETEIRELYACIRDENQRDVTEIVKELQEDYNVFYEEALLSLAEKRDKEDTRLARQRFAAWMEAVLTTGTVLIKSDEKYIRESFNAYPETAYVLLILPFYLALSDRKDGAGLAEQLLLEKPLADSLQNILKEEEIESSITVVNLLTLLSPELETQTLEKPEQLMTKLLKYNEVTRFLRENRYNNILYFHKESFEKLLWFLYLFSGIAAVMDAPGGGEPAAVRKKLKKLTAKVRQLKQAAEKSGYATEQFIEYCRNL